MHLLWEPTFEPSRIQIDLPPDLTLKELLNVDSFTTCDSTRVTIDKLKTSNFFGLVVSHDTVPQEQHLRREIVVQLFSGQGEVSSHTFVTNVYRPLLSVMDCPSSVAISGDRVGPLRISLKLSGFGNIQVRTEISVGGEFVELSEPLYEEMVRRMITTLNLGKTAAETGSPIRIDPSYLERKAKESVEKMERGIFPLDIDEEDLKEFRAWLADPRNRESVMSLIVRHMESLLVDSLLFYLERYPGDNIELAQGTPRMFIEKATQAVKLRFRYRDMMLNEYPPVELGIDVDDRRPDKGRRVEIPINLNWTTEILSVSNQR
jgi:hypothetical protein